VLEVGADLFESIVVVRAGANDLEFGPDEGSVISYGYKHRPKRFNIAISSEECVPNEKKQAYRRKERSIGGFEK
jgi:hypothetical protein